MKHEFFIKISSFLDYSFSVKVLTDEIMTVDGGF